jgi:uroporphyrinogen-III synthase
MAVLRDRFVKTADEAVRASWVGAGDSVFEQAMRRVASLVTIRRITPGGGDDLDSVLVRAETALADGDLAGAIDAVRRLEGAPAQAVAKWLATAEARSAVDTAVRRLQAKAIAGVTGG